MTSCGCDEMLTFSVWEHDPVSCGSVPVAASIGAKSSYSISLVLSDISPSKTNLLAANMPKPVVPYDGSLYVILTANHRKAEIFDHLQWPVGERASPLHEPVTLLLEKRL